MSTHKGRLWLVPERDSKLRVDIHLDSERIRIASHGVVIGDWSLSEIDVREIGNNRARFVVEGEEVVISSRDPQFMPSLLCPPSGDNSSVPSPPFRLSVSELEPNADQEVGVSKEKSAAKPSLDHRAARRLFWATDPDSQAS
ncbi:MAG: hypothetical protein ACLFRT_15360 [Actinomycetota bacterium]